MFAPKVSFIFHFNLQSPVSRESKEENELTIYFHLQQVRGECFSFLLPQFLDAEYGADRQEEKKKTTEKIYAEGCCDKRMLEIG